MIHVEDLGLYRLDRESAATPDGVRIIDPTLGAGRWFKMSTALNDHNNLQSIQGGSASERNHITNAELVDVQAIDQVFTSTEQTKLSGIETSATADQSDAEIKTAYENNANTNAFTDAEQTKLTGIEANAKDDQSAAEIKGLYESNSDTNAFDNAAQSKLGGIETSATADQTGAEIKALYEAEPNAFTDAKDTKLAGIETSATADQSDAEIKTGYENNANTNAFTDADESKLDGLAAGADVTGPGSSTQNALARYSGTTGKILKNSLFVVTDAGEGSGLKRFDFTPISSIPDVEGAVYYDNEDKALSLKTDIAGSTQSLGQEFWVRVINKTGSQIDNGEVVYINGADVPSGRITVDLAQADSELTANVLGFATNNIANNAEGWVTVLGFLNDLDTSSFSAGDQIFLSDTVAGGVTTTKPTIVVPVGFVTQVDASTGQIFASVNRINTDSPIFAQLVSALDQVPGTTNPTVITYDIQNDIAGLTHSVSVNAGEITIDIDGTYYYIIECQVSKGSGVVELQETIFTQIDTGSGFVDVSDSGTRQTIRDAGRQEVLVYADARRLEAGDKVRVMQRVSSTTGGLGLISTAAETGPPTIPATSSAKFSMLRIGGF